MKGNFYYLCLLHIEEIEKIRTGYFQHDSPCRKFLSGVLRCPLHPYASLHPSPMPPRHGVPKYITSTLANPICLHHGQHSKPFATSIAPRWNTVPATVTVS